MQPELLEQINTNYFKAEALCWGFSECSWWSFIASFVNLQCELFSLCKGALRKEKVPLFSLTVLSSTLVQPLSAAGHANPSEGWVSCFESFAGWEVSENSHPSRIGPCSGLSLGEKIPWRPLQVASSQMRIERSLRSTNWTLVPPQRRKTVPKSVQLRTPSPHFPSRKMLHPLHPQRQHSLGHCQTHL